MDNEFKKFILSPNRISKGEKLFVLKEKYKGGVGYFLAGEKYPIILERDIIIADNYKPYFKAYTTDRKGRKYRQENIPNPYINFVFKTDGAVMTYYNIQSVKKTLNNVFVVDTEKVEFLVRRI